MTTAVSSASAFSADAPLSAAALDHRSVVRFTGRDVLPFLQTKLACDTRRWRLTGGGYGVAVDINGKLVFDGHFALDGAGVLAVVTSDRAAAAVEHLDKFVIMEDVAMTCVDVAVVQVWGAGHAAAVGLAADRDPDMAAYAVTAGTAFASVNPLGDPIALLVGADAGALLALTASHGAAIVSATGLEELEIGSGVPRLGRDLFAERTIPLEAGLWAGVSLSKGCYLGQEVLERMYSRGSAARRLVRLTGAGAAPNAGAALLAEDEDAGELTSAVASAGGWKGLGWVRRRFLDAGALSLAGAPVTIASVVGGEAPSAP
ncbi:MAG: hypothetical protein H6697_08685 [Myxococcales bacterium]|nr:hypothetical protein [Myxococcales bacterium]